MYGKMSLCSIINEGSEDDEPHPTIESKDAEFKYLFESAPYEQYTQIENNNSNDYIFVISRELDKKFLLSRRELDDEEEIDDERFYLRKCNRYFV